MKHIIAAILFGLFTLPLTLSGADSTADRPLETNKDKVSYSIGLDLGKYLTNMKGKIDYELLKQGIDDGFSKSLLPPSRPNRKPSWKR